MGAVMDGFVGRTSPGRKGGSVHLCFVTMMIEKGIGLIWISGTMSDRIVPESQGP